MKELYAHCIVLVSVIFAPLACHASFGANSADLSTVPFAHMAAGGSRNYDGLGDYAGYSYQDNYSTETLLGVACLKWVSPTPSGADSSMKHDDIIWLARDVSGSVWMFKQERDGVVKFSAASLASLRSLDQTMMGKLMTGNYGVGTSITSTGDGGKTYVTQITATNALLAEYPGFYFVQVRETEQSSGYFDEYYYHESVGMVKKLINTNMPDVYEGWEYAGGLSAHSKPAITVQPQSQTNLAGTTQAFSVTATGTTPLVYHWRKNGSNLIDGGNISGVTTTNLTVSNLQSNNAGNYTVVITNSYGSVTSSVAALTVLARVRPTLTVTSPTANQRWSNVVFIASGTAAGNAGLAGIWVNVNSSGWIPGYGTTSWTSTNRLMPGTNVLQFFALDTNGICSLTNQISLDYVVTNQLHVQSVGLGTISPNYSNAWLEIGRNYCITSTPAAGFAASNWVVSTNWVGGAAANGRIVHFMMASNLTLQATFMDTNRPTVSITNLVSGQRVSNAVITVSGKAADNWQVTGVNVQANYGGWTSAVGTNNWSARLNLTAGTNLVQAYAVDNSGNVSLTNTIKINYVPSSPLTVQIVGAGSVTPNYNGACLAIGSTYMMTATASNGFAFYYWGGGVTMTTNKTLTFTMSSNLSITANFRDVTKPAMPAITFPVANQKWSNATITVTGKASDNVGVTDVGVQINNGGWVAAGTINGFANWTATNLPVSFGTNIIQAYAMDAAGNVSPTNVVRFVANGVPGPNMVLIPAGSFTMGTDDEPAWWEDHPTHTVNLSAFYMEKYDVTYELWQQVFNWAVAHGYAFNYAGTGKAANHPVLRVDWFDCVAWCNARSEMEGRVPAYYTDATQTKVVRWTSDCGYLTNDCVKWHSGYRLPTEAEWEYAARGGLSGQRFPWGNTISWSQANYRRDIPGYVPAYDLGTGWGFNPAFTNGVWPYTSPVDYFAPNGYGLYDMAGNVNQWCWDQWGDYSSASQTDPHGPSFDPTYAERMYRGGAFDWYGQACWTAIRSSSSPGMNNGDVGLRCVLPAGQ